MSNMIPQSRIEEILLSGKVGSGGGIGDGSDDVAPGDTSIPSSTINQLVNKNKNDLTYAEISAIVRAGRAKEVWELGDVICVNRNKVLEPGGTINGENAPRCYMVVDFKNAELKNGDVVPAMTLMSTEGITMDQLSKRYKSPIRNPNAFAKYNERTGHSVTFASSALRWMLNAGIHDYSDISFSYSKAVMSNYYIKNAIDNGYSSNFTKNFYNSGSSGGTNSHYGGLGLSVDNENSLSYDFFSNMYDPEFISILKPVKRISCNYTADVYAESYDLFSVPSLNELNCGNGELGLIMSSDMTYEKFIGNNDATFSQIFRDKILNGNECKIKHIEAFDYFKKFKMSHIHDVLAYTTNTDIQTHTNMFMTYYGDASRPAVNDPMERFLNGLKSGFPGYGTEYALNISINENSVGTTLVNTIVNDKLYNFNSKVSLKNASNTASIQDNAAPITTNVKATLGVRHPVLYRDMCDTFNSDSIESFLDVFNNIKSAGVTPIFNYGSYIKKDENGSYHYASDSNQLCIPLTAAHACLDPATYRFVAKLPGKSFALGNGIRSTYPIDGPELPDSGYVSTNGSTVTPICTIC